MRRYFITGLLVWIPLGITLWVIGTLITTMDNLLLLLPSWMLPELHIPGIGVILGVLLVFTTGLLTANIFGARLLRWSEELLLHIPIIRTIYGSIKQVSDTVLSDSGQAFHKALLVRFPHSDTWTIAFLTGTPVNEIADKLDGEYISVYVPTTPNPTSGYLIMLKKSDAIELTISVEQALKYVISMGVASPNPTKSAANEKA